jgi:hypothetical protein
VVRRGDEESADRVVTYRRSVVDDASTDAILKDRVAYRNFSIGKGISYDNQFTARSVLTVWSQRSSLPRVVIGKEGVTRTLNLCSSGRFGCRVTTLSHRCSLLRSPRSPLVRFEELFYEWGSTLVWILAVRLGW